MPDFRRKRESLLRHWENNTEVCIIPVQNVADSEAVSGECPSEEASDQVSILYYILIYCLCCNHACTWFTWSVVLM